MGRWKDQAYDMMDEARDQKIAKILGIEYDELSSMEFTIETDSSKDGLIYNYRIEFDEDSSTEKLEKIDRLQDGFTVYLGPWELDDEPDYDDYYDSIIREKNFLEKFHLELNDLLALSSLRIPDEVLKEILNRQIYIGVIGTMETFLAEAFINLTIDNEEFFKNFVQTHPEFRQKKFELREIFDASSDLKDIAKKIMLDTIYHNLPTIRNMFRDTFKISFPEFGEIYKSILKRHDLVHRNGKTKDGEIVSTNESEISQLVEQIRNFIDEIANKLGIENNLPPTMYMR